jgi:hypothetical protein
MREKPRHIILLFISLFLIQFSLLAQGVNTPFGQNRLPFKKTDWQVLSTENVDAFYYEGGKNLATYAQLTAAENLGDIEELFSYRIGGKIEIIIFNTIEDLRQSNTGLQEQLFNVGGYTYVVDNKVIAWYNGTHEDFERQIKQGIAEIILSEMIYGNSLQERAQSASLLFLPSWFFKGLTSYAATPWDTKIDSRVRDGILTGKFEKFNLLDEDDAILAGHSIWNYIAAHYGQKYIADILYLSRISKGYESAFNYTLGITSQQLIDDWLKYYNKKYQDSEQEREVPRKLLNIPDKVSGYPHTQLRTHPNGRKVAFVMNKNGFWQVKIFDKHEKREFTVFTGGKHEGYQVINYEYPILAWDTKGKHLGVLYYENGKSKLVKIDKDGKITNRYKISNQIDQVLSFDFATDNTLLLSAIRNGQTDLYLYDLENAELTQLTDDIYDDLWPRFNTDQTQLIFSSNRPYDTLQVGTTVMETLHAHSNFDVFLYDYANKNNVLKRITNTPHVNEVQPVFYVPGYFSFVSDISGIYNAYACRDTFVFKYALAYVRYNNGTIDTLTQYSPLPQQQITEIKINGTKYVVGDSTGITKIETLNVYGSGYKYFPLTNYKRNIISRDLASTDDAEYNLLLFNNRYQIFETNISPDVEDDAQYINIVPTEYRLGTGIQFFYGDEQPETSIVVPNTQDIVVEKGNFTLVHKDSVKEVQKDTGLYHYQTDFPEDFVLNQFSKKRSATDDMGLKKGKPSSFFTAMFPDYYVLQLDNSIINTYYHLNTNGAGPSVFANMNIMFQAKTTISDLLGNHRINAGARFPFSLNGSDYFIDYQNRKHKVNWDVGFFRQSRRIDGQITNRQLINELRAGIKLPINETVSIRLSAFGRQDRSIILGTDSFTLQAPDTYYNWAGTKAEIVFDNTKNIDINLPFGSRFKLFGEYYNDITTANRQIINLGADYRKYIKLHNKIIWATRVTLNASVGPSKVQYYIGGVENWLGGSYNGAINRGEGSQYVFQSQANGLRGFKQNIRNGSNYALINTEVRIPIAAYITQKPVKADYLRNFMLVPFIDIGTAWYGKSPFDEQPYNTQVIPAPGGGYIITLTTAGSPIVASTGLGMRTRLFGYYLRLDFAWGLENREFGGRMTQFALGYDF